MNRSGKGMDELKSLLGLKEGQNIMDLNNDQWGAMYDDGMISLEKYAPFKEQIKDVPYRYKWILEKVNSLEKGNSLDVGCNNGALVHLMGGKGFTAHGMDVGDKLLEVCLKNVPGGKFVKGFADEEIPFPSNHFQVVTSLEVLEHVKNPEKMVAEMVRVLAPGGKLLITVPVNKEFDCPQHLRYFGFYSLGELFEPFIENFKICRIYKQGEQDGLRALFALEATK